MCAALQPRMAKQDKGGITRNYRGGVFLAVILQMRDELPLVWTCLVRDSNVHRIKHWLTPNHIDRNRKQKTMSSKHFFYRAFTQ